MREQDRNIDSTKKDSLRLAKLSQAKQALLEKRMRGELIGSTQSQEVLLIKPIPRDGELPLSFAQEERLLHYQRGCEQPVRILPHHIPLVFRLRGPLNVAALEQSISEIVRRHEVLRAAFPMVDGRPAQVIAPSSPLKLPLLDLSESPQSEREAKCLQLAAEEVERPFDIASGPLLRASLVKLSENDHILVGAAEHLIFDGFSIRVLLREMALLYEAFSNNKVSPLPELAIQYVDYAYWQRERFESKALEDLLSYWKKRFDGDKIFPELELPNARPTPTIRTYQGARQSLMIPSTIFEPLMGLCRQKDTTLFVLLLTALKTLLHIYTGKEGIGVITPFANREHPQLQSLIGWFAISLNLYTNLSGNPRFTQLLERVRQTTLGAFEYQELPLRKLLKILQPEEYERISKIPSSIFGANYVYFDKSNAKSMTLQLGGLSVSPVCVARELRLTSLSISAIEHVKSLQINVMYEVDRYDAAMIALLLEDYKLLLEIIIADPERRLADLRKLSSVRASVAMIH